MENKIKNKGTYDENGNYKFRNVKKFYAAFDKVGEQYLPVFPAETDMRAIRLLEDTVEDKSTPIGKHPADYRLDKIFEMDMRTGKIVENEVRTIIEAKEYEIKNG